MEIEEEDVPLAEAPVEIIDEDTPLAELPQTGGPELLIAALMGLSGTGCIGLGIKKRRED